MSDQEMIQTRNQVRATGWPATSSFWTRKRALEKFALLLAAFHRTMRGQTHFNARRRSCLRKPIK